MIYITGDMHGDEERLYDREWFKLKKGDVLIVCGDFGYLWNGGEKEREYIEYLGSRKFTVAFIDGTHDNLDLIKSTRKTYWKGGKIHRIKGNLIYLMRGEIFNIDGKTFFTFGGGESTDKDMRLENGLWWKEEMPSPLQMTKAAKRLDDAGCKVD
ncbi:MAG: metallophosphatase family protein, partial [Clostridia bacterium]|nr:metallophosphatase family protein [Clostridia bacterium]